jgi:hypothetical protein
MLVGHYRPTTPIRAANTASATVSEPESTHARYAQYRTTGGAVFATYRICTATAAHAALVVNAMHAKTSNSEI